jgi:hypothetical protein
MARTPLMDALQRLAAYHMAAERLGWPVQAIEERGGPENLDRGMSGFSA